MNNFSFQNPTKIHFGKGQIAQVATEISTDKKVLVLYGGGSIKKNGVYDQVSTALAKHSWSEFSGIEPNPTYETLMKAVAKVKAEGFDHLLAVGGGSVIDGAKFISAAVFYEGKDPWEMLKKHAPFEKTMPVGVVLTLPATGSEMNTGSVVTRTATKEKMGFINPLLSPKFSILDPEVTFSLPEKQTANGVVDAFVHVLEQYLTYPVNAPIQDRMAESLLLTLIENGPKALKDPKNYEVRANIMWSATMALNGLIGTGVPQDWATHMIGHELTAEYGIDHGRTLAIVLPSLLEQMREFKKEKLAQYAQRVWGVTTGSTDDIATVAINKTRQFFEDMGIDTKLGSYGAKPGDVELLVSRLKEKGFVAMGEHQNITPELSSKILTNTF